MVDQLYGLPFFLEPGGESRPIFIGTLSGVSTPGVAPSHEIEEAHVRHLTQLNLDGNLVACGLTSEDQGYLILKAESKDQAESFLRKDPLVESQYYTKFTVVQLFGPLPSDRPSHHREAAHK